MPTPPPNPSSIAHHDVRDDPPFLVVPYMDDFRDCLGDGRFAAMGLSVNSQTVHNEGHGGARSTAVGAWKKCWWLWCCSNASELSCYLFNTDLLYGSWYEEVGYEQRASHIVAQFYRASEDGLSLVLDNALAISGMYDQFYGIAN